MATNSILAKLLVKIIGDTADFDKAVKKTQNELTAFTGNITKLAGAVGIAFGVREVTQFGIEISRLAGEADGVKTAFDRLPDSIRVMEEMKRATGGTVSELELMKNAVQASNFQIPIENLGKLFEFATLRAQQTGQSVEYLTQSIILGIGRKSPLILDNLGISAIRLREKLKGVSAEAATVGDVAKVVGDIANEELGNMAGFAENAATKMQRLSASWDDLKVAMGKAVNNSGAVDAFLNGLTNFANALGGDELTTGINQLKSNLGNGSEILERFAAAGGKIDLSWQELMARGFVANEEAARKYEKVLADIQLQAKNLALANEAVADTIDPITGLPVGGGVKWNPQPIVKQVQTLESLQQKITQLNNQFKTTDITDQKELANIGNKIIGINKQIEALEKLRKKQDEVNEAKLSSFGKKQLKQAESGELDPFGGIKKIDTELPFKEGVENLFPTELPAPNVDLFMNNMQMATAAILELGVTGVQSYDQMRLAGELQAQQQERQTQTALQFGNIFGQVIGSAIDGQKSFTQTLKQATKQLLLLFLQQALGAAIAGSFKTAKNPIIGAVLAGAATGVVSAMFSSIGGPSKSVSGGSGGLSAQSSANSSRFKTETSGEQVVLVGGEFRFQGRQLVVAFDNARKEMQRTG